MGEILVVGGRRQGRTAELMVELAEAKCNVEKLADLVVEYRHALCDGCRDCHDIDGFFVTGNECELYIKAEKLLKTLEPEKENEGL